MIVTPADVERLVRRLLGVSGVSVHQDGPAGHASWVSGLGCVKSDAHLMTPMNNEKHEKYMSVCVSVCSIVSSKI